MRIYNFILNPSPPLPIKIVTTMTLHTYIHIINTPGIVKKYPHERCVKNISGHGILHCSCGKNGNHITEMAPAM